MNFSTILTTKYLIIGNPSVLEIMEVLNDQLKHLCIVEYLKLSNLIDETCPLAIDSHVGNHFQSSKSCSHLPFLVVENNNNNLKYIYKYEASFFIFKKIFYVVNNNQ